MYNLRCSTMFDRCVINTLAEFTRYTMTLQWPFFMYEGHRVLNVCVCVCTPLTSQIPLPQADYLFMRCVSFTFTRLLLTWQTETFEALLNKLLSDGLALSFFWDNANQFIWNIVIFGKTYLIFWVLALGTRCDGVSDAGSTCSRCWPLVANNANRSWRQQKWIQTNLRIASNVSFPVV